MSFCVNMSTFKSDLGITRQCNHFCKNKDLCGHDCCEYVHSFFVCIYVTIVCVSALLKFSSCSLSIIKGTHPTVLQGKVGVAVARKRSVNQESSFSSHLKDLQSRCDSVSQTPVKRLKVRKENGKIFRQKHSPFKGE